MNIFLVTSPLQYICAEEALYEYKTNNNILVLVEQNEESGIKHLKNVFNEKKWDTVIKIKSNQRTITLPKVIKRINSLSKNKEIEHFFQIGKGWFDPCCLGGSQNSPSPSHLRPSWYAAFHSRSECFYRG